MGIPVGESLGAEVDGLELGTPVGISDGLLVGREDGAAVGPLLGSSDVVGDAVGPFDGSSDGI